MLPGATFLADLHRDSCPQGQDGTDWTTEGGGPGDNVDSFASSSDVACAHRINYYAKSPVNYNHTNGITDKGTALG